MTSPGHDPLPRLADALTQVSTQLRDIGQELRVLKLAAPTPTPAPAQQPQAAPQPYPHYPTYPTPYGTFPPAWHAQPPPHPWQPEPQLPEPPPAQPAAAGPAPWMPPPADPQFPRWTPPPRGPSFWDRVSREGAGSRLLAWVGGAVTLAGLVLLLVLAIQRGYIGPLPRILAGGALGAALVGVGLFLHRTPAGRIGAHAVAATGVAAIYLDVIAATSYYSFLPDWAGLIVGLGVAAGGVAIAARWDSQTFAVFVVLCCALTAPILTGGAVTMLVGFLLVLQIATTPVQLAKRWTGLALAAGLPPVIAVLARVAVAHDQHANPLTVLTLCLITGVAQLVCAAATALRSDDATFATGLLLTAPVPTLLGASLVSRGHGAALVASIGALLAAVWVLQRVGILRVPELFATAAGAGAAVATFESVTLAFDGSVRAAALLGGAALFALLAERLRYLGALIASAGFGGVGVLLALGGPLRPEYITRAPASDVPLGTAISAATTGVLGALAAVALSWAAGRVMTSDDPQVDRVRWGFAAGAALYGASAAILSIGLMIAPDSRGFLVGHVLVTVSWTVGALVLLLRHVDSTPLRVAGLALVGAAVIKLVIFDLASLSGIPRVLAFLGAGLVLLAAGARYAALVADRTASPDRPTA